MFHATRNDHKFSCIQENLSLSQLHDQVSTYHQKQLIFLLVMVPDKFTFELDELDMSIVYLTNNFRTPGLGKLGKFFRQAYFFNHATLSFIQLFTWYSWMSYWAGAVHLMSWNRATARVAPTFPLSDEVRSFTTGMTWFAPEERRPPMGLLDSRQCGGDAVWPS